MVRILTENTEEELKVNSPWGCDRQEVCEPLKKKMRDIVHH